MFFTIFPALFVNFRSNSALGRTYPGSTMGLSLASFLPLSLASALSDESPGMPRPGSGLPVGSGASPLVETSSVFLSSSSSSLR